MTDLSWLAEQATQIHGIFSNLFYALITLFLLIGIILEYFKLPLGGFPSLPTLVGRCLVASLMLHAYPEITDFLADIADGLAQKLGNLNDFKLVLSKMGDKLGNMTWSWLSVKETVTMAISFITFFVLYFSIFVCEAFMTYTWTLLYVFSPLLIAFFVLPQTAGATKALFRSLIEVSLWKIVWSVLATLLWSSALSKMNEVEDISFITVICFNLILAGSVLLTPLVVHALAKSGLSGLMGTVGGVAVGATVMSPSMVLKGASSVGKKGYNTGLKGARKVTENNFPRARRIIQRMPEFDLPNKKPIFKKNKSFKD